MAVSVQLLPSSQKRLGGKGHQYRSLALRVYTWWVQRLYLAGPAKPHTFLWYNTCFMSVQLTFELALEWICTMIRRL